MDGQTNVLVLGDTGSGDILLLKYGPRGNLIWQVTYDGSNHWPEASSQMAADARGNLYVTGFSYTTNGWPRTAHAIAMKFDPNGALLWEARCDEAAACQGVSHLDLDAAGLVRISFPSCTAPGLVVLHYSPDGDQVSLRQFVSAPAVPPRS